MRFQILRKLGFIWPLVIVHLQSFSQVLDTNKYIDSLNVVLASADNDSVRARAAFLMANEYSYTDAKKGKVYLEKGKRLSGKNSYLAAVYTFYKAGVYFDSLPDKSSDLYLKAEKQFQQFRQPEALLFRAKCWRNYGAQLQRKDDDKGFLEVVLNKALPLAQQAGDCSYEGSCYIDVGMTFMNQLIHDKAEDYFLKSIDRLASCEPVDQEKRIYAQTFLARNYCFLDDFENAKPAIDKMNELLSGFPQSIYHLDAFEVEAIYYRKINDNEKALSVLKEGIALAEKLSAPIMKNALQTQLYQVYSNLNDYQNALITIQEVINNKGLYFLESDVMHTRHMAEIYSNLKDYPNAYLWMKRYAELKDTVHLDAIKTSISDMELKYNKAENEREIAELEVRQQKQRYISWLLGGGVLFIYYAYRNNRKRNASRLREIEQQRTIEVTKAVLNGEEKERRRLARELHDGLGGALAGIKLKLANQQKQEQNPELDQTIQQLDNSIAELRQISRNMMPESLLRFGLETALDDLCTSLSHDETKVEFQSNGIENKFSSEIQVNTYRIVQELITNAIRHGKATKVIVQCLQSEDGILITVEDNGSGFETANVKTSKGIGLENIRNRVSYLRGKLNIESDKNQGTTVNIELYG